MVGVGVKGVKGIPEYIPIAVRGIALVLRFRNSQRIESDWMLITDSKKCRFGAVPAVGRSRTCKLGLASGSVQYLRYYVSVDEDFIL